MSCHFFSKNDRSAYADKIFLANFNIYRSMLCYYMNGQQRHLFLALEKRKECVAGEEAISKNSSFDEHADLIKHVLCY